MNLEGYKDITKLNKTPSILIDLDGVLNNLNEVWCKLYNERYNDDLDYKNITEWDVTKFYTKCTEREMWELLETPGLFSDMVKPPEDSVNVTKILSNFFELYVVTSCSHPNIIIEKFQYIEKHFPHIHTSDIITCKNKSLIKGNYMIDDYVGNIRAFDGVGLLLNTSYNINIDIPINVYRMGTWNDILIFFSMGNKELRDYLSSDLFKNSGTYIEKFDIKTISGIKSYFNIQKRIVK